MTPGVNFYLTSTKIEGRLTTYNILIIIEKSSFVTSYLHLSVMQRYPYLDHSIQIMYVPYIAAKSLLT